MRLARKLGRLRKDRAGRRRWLIGPDPVDQVVAAQERHRGQPVLKAAQGLDGVQPGVESDPSAIGQGLFNPVRKGRFGPVDGCKDIRDLRLDLHAIAAVDKDARRVAQRHAMARRAGEPRQPSEPVIPPRDVFALMRIGPGNDEAVKPVVLERLAQRRQSLRPLFGGGGLVETLKHAASVIWGQNSAFARCRQRNH